MYKVFVAIHAGTLRDSFVTSLDLNRILVVAKRERQRMKESVICFGNPFADRVMRQVAIVADRHMMVARMLP